MSKIEAEKLRAHESTAATSLLRRSLAPELIEHGTVRCSGYAMYLADQLTTPLPPAVDAWAVRDNRTLVGVLIANRGHFSSHLSYVAVAAEHRGRGIARALTEAWVAHSTARGCATLTLDVAATNGPARHLYSRAGFTYVGSRRETVTPLAGLEPSDVEAWWSDDLTGFLGSFRRYGFGRLRLLSEAGSSLRVGILESGFVRHPVSDELRSATRILRQLLPHGHVLSSEPVDDIDTPDVIYRLEKVLESS